MGILSRATARQLPSTGQHNNEFDKYGSLFYLFRNRCSDSLSLLFQAQPVKNEQFSDVVAIV